jgi:hypothetical protein
VSVKLTPEICINKASSNSRLTAAGRWAAASDNHSQNCLRTLLFFSLLLWWDNNLTTPACWKIYWNCIALELGTLCGVWFGLVFFPLWWDYFWDTISRIGGWGTNTKIIKTETLLHLNLEIYFYFYFYFIFQSSLYLSKACLAYCCLVHYLSLFISLKLCFFVCFVLFYLFICFSLFL